MKKEITTLTSYLRLLKIDNERLTNELALLKLQSKLLKDSLEGEYERQAGADY